MKNSIEYYMGKEKNNNYCSTLVGKDTKKVKMLFSGQIRYVQNCGSYKMRFSSGLVLALYKKNQP